MCAASRPRVASLALGILAIDGQDAEDFLNGQFSQRVPRPSSPPDTRLVAWHDAQGRVRCLCRVMWAESRYVLVLEASDISALAQQLQRYALRAAVSFEILGDWRAAALLLPTAEPGSLELAAATNGEACIATIGPGLAYMIGPAEAVAAAVSSLAPVAPAAASLAEIRIGLPPLRYWPAPQHVGQMLNLDRLGAIAFDKGCYPGQEILTRVHRLGDVKRRTYRYRGDGHEPAPATPIRDARDRDVGEVLRVAREEGANFELLAVVPTDSRDEPLYCGSTPARLERLPLPTDEPASR